jgi:hypothetical protein
MLIHKLSQLHLSPTAISGVEVFSDALDYFLHKQIGYLAIGALTTLVQFVYYRSDSTKMKVACLIGSLGLSYVRSRVQKEDSVKTSEGILYGEALLRCASLISLKHIRLPIEAIGAVAIRNCFYLYGMMLVLTSGRISSLFEKIKQNSLLLIFNYSEKHRLWAAHQRIKSLKVKKEKVEILASAIELGLSKPEQGITYVNLANIMRSSGIPGVTINNKLSSLQDLLIIALETDALKKEVEAGVCLDLVDVNRGKSILIGDKAVTKQDILVRAIETGSLDKSQLAQTYLDVFREASNYNNLLDAAFSSARKTKLEPDTFDRATWNESSIQVNSAKLSYRDLLVKAIETKELKGEALAWTYNLLAFLANGKVEVDGKSMTNKELYLVAIEADKSYAGTYYNLEAIAETAEEKKKWLIEAFRYNSDNPFTCLRLAKVLAPAEKIQNKYNTDKSRYDLFIAAIESYSACQIFPELSEAYSLVIKEASANKDIILYGCYSSGYSADRVFSKAIEYHEKESKGKRKGLPPPDIAQAYFQLAQRTAAHEPTKFGSRQDLFIKAIESEGLEKADLGIAYENLAFRFKEGQPVVIKDKKMSKKDLCLAAVDNNPTLGHVYKELAELSTNMEEVKGYLVKAIEATPENGVYYFKLAKLLDKEDRIRLQETEYNRITLCEKAFQFSLNADKRKKIERFLELKRAPC